MSKAFLFDLNGTMIDDMEYHINAWYKILNDLGASISYEETKHQCYGKNHELLERIFPGRFTLQEKDAMSLEKERQYQQAFLPELKLIKGLDVFLKDAYNKKTPMAIGSAAIMFNIDFVLDGLNIRHYFSAIVSADDVKESKPHPETYLQCAEQLGVKPADCIVFEDAPKGVEAAANAGMQAVVITTMHEKDEFSSYHNIHSIIKDFEGFQIN
ncbi:MAG TPA: HAD family phosphatase [Chitinophagaceae bacterium]|nr:HAD family phosphatase [Chitinophagaceae bacterium]HPG10300.1 HAD family phosphatase [Chitinophagaceae bacterium]HRX94684.1 HAD family phosphatase [Chitinophagaceae bacterium]